MPSPRLITSTGKLLGFAVWLMADGSVTFEPRPAGESALIAAGKIDEASVWPKGAELLLARGDCPAFDTATGYPEVGDCWPEPTDGKGTMGLRVMTGPVLSDLFHGPTIHGGPVDKSGQQSAQIGVFVRVQHSILVPTDDPNAIDLDALPAPAITLVADSTRYPGLADVATEAPAAVMVKAGDNVNALALAKAQIAALIDDVDDAQAAIVADASPAVTAKGP